MMINFSNVNTQNCINLPPDTSLLRYFLTLTKCNLTIIMIGLGESENSPLRILQLFGILNNFTYQRLVSRGEVDS